MEHEMKHRNLTVSKSVLCGTSGLSSNLARSLVPSRIQQPFFPYQFVAGEHDYEIIRETKIVSKGMAVEKTLALGFETTRTISTNVAGDKKVWQERVLAVFSPTSARTTRQAFSKRLNQAEAKLLALTPPRGHGQRQWHDIDALKEAAQKIIQQEKVDQFLTVDYQLDRQRRYIRAYKERQPRYEEQSRYVISVERNQKAIKNARRSMGWRLYATNAPVDKLPLAKAVKVYRGAPAIERDFARLKGKSLGIRPLYVQREQHVKGMVRLLSLALRILTTIEYLVRLRVARTGKPIEGLYPGNPKRQTTRPTTERLLQAFKGVTLTIWEEGDNTKQHITPLTLLQARILRFMGLTKEIYMQLIEPT
jgi:transposase